MAARHKHNPPSRVTLPAGVLAELQACDAQINALNQQKSQIVRVALAAMGVKLEEGSQYALGPDGVISKVETPTVQESKDIEKKLSKVVSIPRKKEAKDA